MNIFQLSYYSCFVAFAKKISERRISKSWNSLKRLGSIYDYNETYKLFKEQEQKSKNILEKELIPLLEANGRSHPLHYEYFLYCLDFTSQADFLEMVCSDKDTRHRINNALSVFDIPLCGCWMFVYIDLLSDLKSI